MIGPVPLVPIPIAELELVQLIFAPGTLLANGMFTDSVGQNSLLVTAVTTGSGLIVILKVFVGPGHEFLVADTVMVATNGAPVVFTGAVYAPILPVPLAGKPTAVLSLVQLNVSLPPVFAVKLIAEIGASEQATTSAIVFTIGVGLIVIVNVFLLGVPLVQPFRSADTVIEPTISTPVLFAGAA
jgi:hypothetical protein